MPFLIEPSAEYQSSFIDALNERQSEPLKSILNTLLVHYHGNHSQLVHWLTHHFDHYLTLLNLDSQTGQITARQFPYCQYWLIDQDQFIGNLIIRYSLSPHVAPGHIGYYIRPSQRSKGYGKLILNLGIQKAFKLGLSKILLTCSKDNLASQKVILHNSGQLDLPLSQTHQSENRLFYWIYPTSHKSSENLLSLAGQ